MSMATDVYGYNVVTLDIFQVHVVPMKCEKTQLKSEILDEKSKFPI